ncbi:MAG: SDR family oxidoreductase [Candidatus Micrarchaeota archaeon]|nr:SDR family oxidoreductase [Candidatus Micrarchaeota archaeon]
MAEKNVLMTGNRGYIGRIMADLFLRSGYNVSGIDAGYFGTNGFAKSMNLRNPKVQLKMDFRDFTDFKGMDAVVHLAGLPNDWAADLNPKMAEELNSKATIDLALRAKAAGVKRFIFASSCSVFGANGDKLISEESKPAPVTPYGFSKLHAEEGLLKLNDDSFTVTCMRNATCYGVSPRMRFDMVLNNLVAYAFVEGKVKVLSDGTAWRPIVHIRDVSVAFLKALEADREVVSGQVFAVGGYNYTVSDIAKIAKAAVPGSMIEFNPQGQKDPRSYNVDFTKIKKALDFSCEWTPEKGAKELYEAYREYGLNKESFQQREFWAGKQLEYLIKNKFVNDKLYLNSTFVD